MDETGGLPWVGEGGREGGADDREREEGAESEGMIERGRKGRRE